MEDDEIPRHILVCRVLLGRIKVAPRRDRTGYDNTALCTEGFHSVYGPRQDAYQGNRPRYTFYDGPSFTAGLPHYGHILVGTIKDTVTRWAYQTGHHVERRLGW
ncbi:unnamed protein product, partial [Rotaria magnacalcarata]